MSIFPSLEYFRAATGDFHQRDEIGIQASGLKGHVLENGNFIFSWIDENMRKMVLTTNKGEVMEAGHVDEDVEDWTDVSTWINHRGEYWITNFEGVSGGRTHSLHIFTNF